MEGKTPLISPRCDTFAAKYRLATGDFAFGLKAIGVVSASCLALGHVVPWRLAITMFCLVAPCYGIDRLKDAARDSAAEGGCGSNKRDLKPRIAFYLALFIGSLFAAYEAGVWTPLACLFFPLSVIFYVVPVLPKSFRIRRIKDIPYTKGVYTAVMWTGLLPFAAKWVGEPIGLRVFVVAVHVALAIFVNEITLDFKDVEADVLNGVKTLPTSLGRKRTVEVLEVMALLAVVYAQIMRIRGLLNSEFAVLASIHGFVTMVSLTALRHDALDTKPSAFRFGCEMSGMCSLCLLWTAISLLLS